MTIPIAMVGLHFVADFLLQSDWMSLNKSKAWRPLLAHTVVYSLCFVPFYGLRFALVTMALHTATDAVTSRVTARLWAAKQNHWFFAVIGLDQFIHYTCLAWTLTLVA